MKLHNWKKYMLYITSVMLLLVTLAACGANQTNDSSTALKSPLNKETELTVLLDWYPNAVHAFLYAAEEQGYFKEAGLNVKLQTPADTNDALKLVATGKADLALSYQMQVAISRAEDIPIVSVAAIVRHPLNRLFVLNSAEVHSPKDLANKKIGYPSIPLDQIIVDTMVATDAGDTSKLSYVDIGWDLIPAMTTKKVDAIIGGYVNHEKLLLEKEGMELSSFDPSEYGVPDYYELVLTASEEGLESKGAAIKAFIEAAAKGQQYTVDHPKESLQNLLDSQSESFSLDAQIEKQSLDILLPLMDAGSEPFGSQTQESWDEIISFLNNNGQLGKKIKAEEVFRNL